MLLTLTPENAQETEQIIGAYEAAIKELTDIHQGFTDSIPKMQAYYDLLYRITERVRKVKRPTHVSLRYNGRDVFTARSEVYNLLGFKKVMVDVDDLVQLHLTNKTFLNKIKRDYVSLQQGLIHNMFYPQIDIDFISRKDFLFKAETAAYHEGIQRVMDARPEMSNLVMLDLDSKLRNKKKTMFYVEMLAM